MGFARRTDWPVDQNPLALKIAALKAAGEPLIDLTESNPTRCDFQYQNTEWLQPFLDPKNLAYEPLPRGLLSAREAVCAYYAEKGVRVEPEQVFLTAGTSEAYGFLFRLLAEPGESFLVPSPGYPLFNYLADLNDAVLKKYALSQTPRWHLDAEILDNASGPDCKALVLVNPNNPTGNFISVQEKEVVNHFCASRNLALISDEVFLDYSLGGQGVSLADNAEVLTFTLSGISKILGFPQMKLSWLVVSGPKAIREQALQKLEVIADTFLSVNTPSQRALPEWMKSRTLAIREISDRTARNQEFLLRKFLQGVSCRALRSEGGWYAVLKLGEGADDEQTALDLLEKQKILAHPGYLYDFDAPHLVLSLLVPCLRFEEAIDRLSNELL